MKNKVKSIEELKKEAISGRKFKFIFFWGHQTSKEQIGKQCLSQWYPCKFVIENIVYNSTEQYMMAQKALLFNDNEIFHQIIKEKQMKKIKDLGRQVKCFNEKIWNEAKLNIVINGNLAKFQQNSLLKDYLISTDKKILVEASPYDKIWGIGMLEDDENIENISKWRGLNLLGFALMEVRDIIINSLE